MLEVFNFLWKDHMTIDPRLGWLRKVLGTYWLHRRAGQENVWLKDMAVHRPNAVRSVQNEHVRAKIYVYSSPAQLTQSISILIYTVGLFLIIFIFCACPGMLVQVIVLGNLWKSICIPSLFPNWTFLRVCMWASNSLGLK